jgi:predicted nucleic acid-binding protein
VAPIRHREFQEVHNPQALMRTLFDTNILIDYLNGVPAAETLVGKTRHRMVSVVTWMEVLAGARTPEEEDVIEMFLRDFKLVELSRPIARGAVALRKTRRLRLPDAIILATAQHESAVLVTRNTKDFLPANRACTCRTDGQPLDSPHFQQTRQRMPSDRRAMTMTPNK